MDASIMLLILGTLASKIIDVLKFIRSKDWNATITQVATWIAGVVVVFLASGAEVTSDITIPSLGVTFGTLDTGSKVLIGTAITSLLSMAYDFRKAFDGTDSAKAPPLTNL